MADFPAEPRDQDTSKGLLWAARLQGVIFRKSLDGDGWLLGIVLKADVFDNKTDVRVRFLEEDRPVGRFLYQGTSPFLAKNSTISYKGDLISVPDATSLEPISFGVKWLR